MVLWAKMSVKWRQFENTLWVFRALCVGSYCIRFVQQAGVMFASIGGESSALAKPKLLLSQALSTHSEYV